MNLATNLKNIETEIETTISSLQAMEEKGYEPQDSEYQRVSMLIKAAKALGSKKVFSPVIIKL